ncbi:hypothetical protein [Actinomadura madurae]|uniref:hypothetical protein n=1 Tax=Actinomadura madurae TaxID=1993 RepID=UPI0020D220D4|nr:hypothetical protein [Actinomadura madurae]MCP9947151.1 hypothetical protein [Actinomadura madurae]MCP9963912.1 hypothetical protein [Actinomadura madurae]MCQ0012583.1 hypothetical protein [Actinomadura madurae]
MSDEDEFLEKLPTDLIFRLPPAFDDVEDERRHRKERLTAALRIFGKFGFEEGVAATSPPATPSAPTTSGSTRSACPSSTSRSAT